MTSPSPSRPTSAAALALGPLPRGYFLRDARHLARALLGAYLVRDDGAARKVVRIVETEAYRGPNDAACHARVGLTRRTRTLLGPPGFAYVFLVYGMHECFNVVCLREGAGHAVLVRGGEPVFGIDPGVRTDGPGKLARALGISRADDGHDLTRQPLFVAEGPAPARPRVGVSARVGVAYAGAVADKPWRFFEQDSPFVSRPPASALGQRGARARADASGVLRLDVPLVRQRSTTRQVGRVK